jgi:hypothetical protein
MLLDPWQDVGEVKYGSAGRTDWVFERLKRYRTEIEGQSFEACACYAGFASICTC